MLTVLDYGIGNVRSVLNAFEFIGVDAILTRDPHKLTEAAGLVIPGVGAFGEGMRRLHKYGLCESIHNSAQVGKPILGICLGFQLMMMSSTEQGCHKGLGLIDEHVQRLPVSARLPHIGWSSVTPNSNFNSNSQLLKGLNDNIFYFVHSYGVTIPQYSFIGGHTFYDDCVFVSLVENNNIFGTQFHPEKSGESGLSLLKNFARLCT